MKRADIRYLAGLFDGEGSISVLHHNTKGGKKYLIVSLQLSMTDKESVKLFSSRFGGWFGVLNRKTKRHIEVFKWCVSGVEAATPALKALLPHLRVKNKQAALALEFLRTVHSNRRVSDKEWKRRQEIREEIIRLNATT